MRLEQNSVRRAFGSAGFALAAVCFACSGSPALALDDESTVSSVLGIFGVSWDRNNEKIDYRERPKLVLPPNRETLPEPRDRQARPEAWPVEQDVVQRRNQQALAREPAPPSGAKEDEASAFAGEEPKRALLVEPPRGYRRPTKDLNALPADPEKKTSWSNPLGFIRESANAVFGGAEYTVPSGSPDGK